MMNVVLSCLLFFDTYYVVLESLCKATGSHQWLIYAVQTGITTRWLHVSIFGFVAIVPFFFLCYAYESKERSKEGS